MKLIISTMIHAIAPRAEKCFFGKDLIEAAETKNTRSSKQMVAAQRELPVKNFLSITEDEKMSWKRIIDTVSVSPLCNLCSSATADP